MINLITAEEAIKIIANIEEKEKDELINRVNDIISSQAKKKMRWAHFPNDISELETGLLSYLLVKNGFKINAEHPAIRW